MAEPFTFELVSPEKLLYSIPVAMVTVPGSAGEYGVLAGHAPLMTEIMPGVIRIYADNDATVSSSLFVEGGFAEVSGSRFTVLVQDAIPVADLETSELKKQAKELAAKIAETEDEKQVAALEAQQAILQAKIQAAALAA